MQTRKHRHIHKTFCYRQKEIAQNISSLVIFVYLNEFEHFHYFIFWGILHENAESHSTTWKRKNIFPVWEFAGKPSKSPINQSYISDFIFLCLGLTLMDTTYFHNPFHRPSDCSSGHLLKNSKAVVLRSQVTHMIWQSIWLKKKFVRYI